MEKAGGKPKRAKYINKTFINEKKKKCRNGASRKHHIKAKMRISFLQTLLNFNELCRAEFPLYFLLNVLLLKMFYFLLPMSYTGLRVSRQYAFVCEKTIATYTVYLFISNRFNHRVGYLFFYKERFHQPNSEFTPVVTLASGVTLA
jgi:hypothetical protein